MARASTICSSPGCPNTKPCVLHVRTPWRGHGSRHERGYGSGWERTRKRILARDNYTCYIDGAHANTVDHVKPKYLGGTDDDSNLRACCTRCQRLKAAREGNAALRAARAHARGPR